MYPLIITLFIASSAIAIVGAQWFSQQAININRFVKSIAIACFGISHCLLVGKVLHPVPYLIFIAVFGTWYCLRAWKAAFKHHPLSIDPRDAATEAFELADQTVG